MAEPVSPRALSEGYEPDDVSIRGILIVAAVSLVVLVGIGGALWGMVELFVAGRAGPTSTAVEGMRSTVPPPRLQSAPADDLAALRAREEATLRRFAWIDRSAGIVQIPIEAAMDLLARRGWPQPDRPAPAVPPRASAPGEEPARGAGVATGGEGPAAPRGAFHPIPRTSSDGSGPAQATPPGGER
jgi:hypothetical protein